MTKKQREVIVSDIASEYFEGMTAAKTMREVYYYSDRLTGALSALYRTGTIDKTTFCGLRDKQFDIERLQFNKIG